MNDKISSEDLEEQISATDPDTEKLRAKLSKLIENHHLDAKDKMDTLVRLSASVINALKRDMPNQSTKDGVEKVFFNLFDLSLKVYGLHGLLKTLKELEKDIHKSEYEN